MEQISADLHFTVSDRFIAWIKSSFHDLIKAAITHNTSQLQTNIAQ